MTPGDIYIVRRSVIVASHKHNSKSGMFVYVDDSWLHAGALLTFVFTDIPWNIHVFLCSQSKTNTLACIDKNRFTVIRNNGDIEKVFF